jgi:hypothetical protein
MQKLMNYKTKLFGRNYRLKTYRIMIVWFSILGSFVLSILLVFRQGNEQSIALILPIASYRYSG